MLLQDDIKRLGAAGEDEQCNEHRRAPPRARVARERAHNPHEGDRRTESQHRRASVRIDIRGFADGAAEHDAGAASGGEAGPQAAAMLIAAQLEQHERAKADKADTCAEDTSLVVVEDRGDVEASGREMVFEPRVDVSRQYEGDLRHYNRTGCHRW